MKEAIIILLIGAIGLGFILFLSASIMKAANQEESPGAIVVGVVFVFIIVHYGGGGLFAVITLVGLGLVIADLVDRFRYR